MNETNKESLEGQRDWLDYFYKELYLQIGFGPRQNVYYMEEILKHLDNQVIDFLKRNETTILDMGCAMGFGTIKLVETFPKARVHCLEVCETAVSGGRIRFPEICFIYDNNGLIKNNYDVVISSHCLEHYLDPFDILVDMLKKTNKYCVVMVPYNEYPPLNKHMCTITENTFPERVFLDQNEYVKISSIIFEGDRQLCRNDMIQVVYKKSEN